jgi:hypothetical protein
VKRDGGFDEKRVDQLVLHEESLFPEGAADALERIICSLEPVSYQW